MNAMFEEIDRDRRRIFATAAVAVATAQFGIPTFADARPRQAKHGLERIAEMSGSDATSPTIVLVHGAWADGSSWDRVMALLQAQGLKTMAAPIPLTSLSDDVAALERALERTSGAVVLVSHAYSGAVIGACHNERVRSLVFITSLTPDEGETVANVFYRGKPDPHAPNLKPDRHGYLWIPTDEFGAGWCQNASPEETALLAATQRPISLACIKEKAPKPAWRGKPSWYLVAEEDRMINPETQRFLAGRMGAQTRSEKVDHAVLITAPKVVARIISDAVSSLAADPSEKRSSAPQHG